MFGTKPFLMRNEHPWMRSINFMLCAYVRVGTAAAPSPADRHPGLEPDGEAPPPPPPPPAEEAEDDDEEEEEEEEEEDEEDEEGYEIEEDEGDGKDGAGESPSRPILAAGGAPSSLELICPSLPAA